MLHNTSGKEKKYRTEFWTNDILAVIEVHLQFNNDESILGRILEIMGGDFGV